MTNHERRRAEDYEQFCRTARARDGFDNMRSRLAAC